MASENDQVYTIDVARTLIETTQLPPKAMEALIAATAAPPDPKDWRRFLSSFLAFAGSALALSGVIFFFAYNWAKLGKFAKLGLLELSIIAAAIAAWKLGDRIGGRVSLMIAVVLVGPLLAVYGQTYQTGADPYELFVGWLFLTLPWVVLARMPALWMFSLVLLNTAFMLYWGQILDERYEFGESIPIYLVLVLINTAPWAVWELLGRRGIAWLTPRWPPRLMAVASYTTIVLCLIIIIVNNTDDPAEYGILAVIAWLGIVGASVLYYRLMRHDLFMLAITAASVMTVLTVLFGRILFKEMDADIGGAFVLGLFVVAQVAAVATWLRWEGRRMNQSANAGVSP